VTSIAVIVGLRAEAAALPRGTTYACVGGRPSRAASEARRLLADGAAGLLSFGIAGGLDPAVAPGDLVVGTEVVAGEDSFVCDSRWVEALTDAIPEARRGVIVGASAPLASPIEKLASHRRFHGLAVDLESADVARACAAAGKPFAVLRAVADPATRSIPKSALAGLTATGRMRPFAVARAMLAHPHDLPGLIVLANDTRAALRALTGAARRLGPSLGFEAEALARDK